MSDSMTENHQLPKKRPGLLPDPAALSDADIYAAMQAISGYLDITTNDFKEIYLLAFEHAQQRLFSVPAERFMSTRVFSVQEDSPLAETAAVLADQDISGLPVLSKQGQVSGVISEKDFLKSLTGTQGASFMELIAECIGIKGCPALAIQGQTARDIMSSPALTVEPHTSLVQVSELFTRKSINRVPVVDRKNRLLGILTRDDILRALQS